MNLSQLRKDTDILKTCVGTIVEVFSLPAIQLPDPTHQHQQTVPLQPKLYETSQDVKRISDWAVSTVKCGIKTRDESIKVSMMLRFL